MATDFPNSPANGATHTFGGNTYTYNSTIGAWTGPAAGAGGGASVTVSETAPSSPAEGDLWFDPSVLKTFVYYNDGTANQWVQNNPTGSGGGSGGGASVTASDTAPSSPSAGDLWYKSDTNALYVYYYDGDSNQWVGISGPAGPAGPAGSAGSSALTSYANFAGFPASPTEGDLAYAQDTNALYLYDGTQWDRVYTGLSEVPEFTTSPAASYALAADGTATSVTVAATDPEGFPVTYSHDTNPSNQTQATISQSGGTFTVTPSTNTANAGSFNLRFKASDGLHISSKTSTFNLSFSTEWLCQISNSSSNDFVSYGVAVDSNDNIYFVGETGALGSGIGHITKLDKLGELVWTKTLQVTESSATSTRLMSIEIDSSDNIYTAGYFLDGTDEKYIVAKYNTSGVLQFAKKYVYTGLTNYNVTDLAISPNGNDIYLGFGATTAAISGGTNRQSRFIIKLDSSGVAQWTKAVGSSTYAEYGYQGGLVASNSNVWTSSRTPVSLDDSSSSRYVSGVVKLAASNGSYTAIRLMHDAQHQDVAHSTVGGIYYDTSADRIYQAFGAHSSSYVSGSNEYGIGVYHVTASTMAGQSGSQAVVCPTNADAAVTVDANQEQGRLVKAGSNIYYQHRVAYTSNSATVGGYVNFVERPLNGGTSLTNLGHLVCPNNTAGTGVYPSSLATTSTGRVISLTYVRGGSSKNSSYYDTCITSFDPANFPTTTTAGINSNISLVSGAPSNIGTATITALNFASAPTSGTHTSATPNTYTESTLSNTAGTDSSTRDYTNLAS